MTGAMAGSATLYFNKLTSQLRVMGLTVNNICNLECPHCYLQYDGLNGFIADELIDVVVDAPFEHLAIVGKEPLVNKSHARKCSTLIRKATESGKTVSMITNGLNLNLIDPEVLGMLSWIDVSLDGGAETYKTYRKASFERIISNLYIASDIENLTVNALHTLSSSNINYIDDMAAVDEFYRFDRILFSAYIPTKHEGTTSVQCLNIESVLKHLSQSKVFLESPNSFFLIGLATLNAIDSDEIYHLLKAYELISKVILVNPDPLDLGILRLTYDGYLMTPLQSLHTSDYKEVGSPVKSLMDLQSCLDRLNMRLAA